MSSRRWTELNRQIVACRECERLVSHCRQIAETKRAAYRDWEYWGRPVPNFGPADARLLLVGLAPGAHGSNRTGQMFTGDASGEWLFRAMHRAGFASLPQAQRIEDGLSLIDAAITSAVHCAPPGNMPTAEERQTCRRWLDETLDLSPARVYMALGGLAWQEMLWQSHRRGWLEERPAKFGHMQKLPLTGDRWLLGSYHPSRQNTNTGRLTESMLDAVFAEARTLLGPRSATPNGPSRRRTASVRRGA